MEASPLNSAAAVPALRGPTTLLRLQSDERLVTLTRRGNQSAYEVLVQRYQSRLLAFCRHMLGSKEDAEDVLQEVFANAFNAMVSDTRPINVRPWLYRIARNRSLNHLRRIQPIGVDTLDDRMADNGISAEDTAHKREEFRELLGDVRQLAETQRTALLLREIDALSYDQIAEAMDTTVPSVKSLLVRARVSLAEAAEARNLTCEEVREELGEVSETMRRLSPAFRRHVKECERCAAFQTHLKANNRAMTAIFPLGPLIVLKKLLAHVTAGAGAGGGAAVGSAAAGSVAGSVITTGVGAIATKTAAGLAAAALVTAGAVEVDHARTIDRASASDRIVASASMPAASPPSVGGSTQASVTARGPRGPVAAAAAPVSSTSTTPATTTTGTTTTGTGTSTSTSSTTTTGTTVAGTGTGTSTTTTPFSPTTTTTGPAAPTTTSTSAVPPVDSGTETVTLPEGAATTPPTKPAPAAPSTSSTGEDTTPAPKATPGASGQLDTPKLGTTTKPRKPKRTTTKRRTKTTTSKSTGSRSTAKRTRKRASSYRVTTTKKKSSSKAASAKKRSSSDS